jgi:nucleoside 2-deoxyribosyltransferase
MLNKVFLSYSYEDKHYVEKFKSALESTLARFEICGGVDPIDANTKGIVSKAIRDQIKAADVVVVFLSKNALTSNWVLWELGAAQALGKKVIPIVLEDTAPEKLDFIDTDQAVMNAQSLSPVETARRIEELVA